MRVRQHFIFQQSLQEAIRYVSKRVYPFKKARIKKQCNCKSAFSFTPKSTKSSACTKSKVSRSNNRRGDKIPRYFTTIDPCLLLIQSVRKVFWYGRRDVIYSVSRAEAHFTREAYFTSEGCITFRLRNTSFPKQKALHKKCFCFGGTTQNRTGDKGFAGPCLTAWPWCRI